MPYQITFRKKQAMSSLLLVQSNKLYRKQPIKHAPNQLIRIINLACTSKMQILQNQREKTAMAHSMFVSKGKLRHFSPKNNFIPKRPLAHLDFLNKINEKIKRNNYNSSEKNDSTSHEGTRQQDQKKIIKISAPETHRVNHTQSSIISRIKLTGLKEQYQTDNIEQISLLLSKPQKKTFFLKKNISTVSSSIDLQFQKIVHPTPKHIFKPSHHNSLVTKRSIFVAPRKELKKLIIKGQQEIFQVLKFIDEGSYGKVYLVQHLLTQSLFCLKSIEKCQLTEPSFNQLIRESIIQSYLSHPNIVNLYSIAADAQYVYLLLQACPGLNLYRRIKGQPLGQKQVRKYVKEVCLAVQYMHKNDVIHRDIKPENIIIYENTVKICDFGWAVHSPLLRNTQCGTPLYTPPEIVKHQYYDSKIDIWCIGMLTYQLLYGSVPFQIRNPNDLQKIVTQQVYFSKQIKISQAARNFIENCLAKDAHKRYTIRQALEDDFLATKLQAYRHSLS